MGSCEVLLFLPGAVDVPGFVDDGPGIRPQWIAGVLLCRLSLLSLVCMPLR